MKIVLAGALLALVATVTWAQTTNQPASAYGAQAKVKWPGPGPGALSPTPDPVGTGLLGPLVPPILKTFKKPPISCPVSFQGTSDDLVRPPGAVPKGQAPDPTGFAETVVLPSGDCYCLITIETSYLKTAPAQDINDKIAHELCHCLQTTNGYNGTYDENGNFTPGKNQIEPVTKLEANASRCADRHTVRAVLDTESVE